jgi:hypothetical protein
MDNIDSARSAPQALPNRLLRHALHLHSSSPTYLGLGRLDHGAPWVSMDSGPWRW